ncbi:MAG: HAD-IIIC family phosphatase [Cytophagales bacterium]|nr:HAD-IIIC family phosphatase [Cytophagales bacterium]
MLTDFKGLRKLSKKPSDGLPIKKLAILSDSSTQFLRQAIKGHGFEKDLNLEIYEGAFNQMELELLDDRSDLYAFKPDFIFLFFSAEKLLSEFLDLDPGDRKNWSQLHLDRIQQLLDLIRTKSKSNVMVSNCWMVEDAVFGNYGNKAISSWRFQSSLFNVELMREAQSQNELYVVDLEKVKSTLGQTIFEDDRLRVNGDISVGLDALPQVAKVIVDMISANSGKVKKCLVLDLDHTLWGGVIGDDGMEGILLGESGIGREYCNIQRWAKALKERGVLLAICSKNDEEIAKEPFRQHPSMMLRLEDITMFVANWHNKADNIRTIKEALNIGYDSFVFIDDNPFERELVRTELPDVSVPELPEDPAEYLSYIRSLNLFEASSYSQEDAKRTEMYQQEVKRVAVKSSFTDLNQYLRSLEMKAIVKPFTEKDIARISQLTQRSNQFNLRTIRYSESDISAMMSDKSYRTWSVFLQDKFGEYGLISLAIAKVQSKQYFVDSWIMSCRVLKRGVELLLLDNIMKNAKEDGVEVVLGEYLKTKKNALVEDHYPKLGFTHSDQKWKFETSGFSTPTYFIEQVH